MRLKDEHIVKDFVKKNFLVSIFAVCLLLQGCQNSGKYPVYFVDRNSAFLADQKQNPLRLIVEIKEVKLSLNKIETGTLDDVSLLSEKLKAVFDDRKRAGIDEREVVIDPQDRIESEKLEKLIECLTKAEAKPILVIKNNY